MYFAVGTEAVVIEKDPNIQRIKQQVAEKMRSIIEQEESVNSNIFLPKLKFVSFVDALKELVNQKNL